MAVAAADIQGIAVSDRMGHVLVGDLLFAVATLQALGATSAAILPQKQGTVQALNTRLPLSSKLGSVFIKLKSSGCCRSMSTKLTPGGFLLKSGPRIVREIHD